MVKQKNNIGYQFGNHAQMITKVGGQILATKFGFVADWLRQLYLHVLCMCFNNGFSIAIQIRWKFRFTLTSILIQWSLQNFVRGTTVCKNLLRSDGQQRELWQGEVSIEFELHTKKVSETGPWMLLKLRGSHSGHWLLLRLSSWRPWVQLAMTK